MKITVTAAELSTLLDRAPPGIRVLSLDCFDTLLWRNCQAPADVFAALDVPGGAVHLRAGAESRARRRALATEGRHEVSIAEIYRSLHPNADDAAIAAAVAGELAAEARHCFGFEPAAQLIRAAKARGLRTVIVSDTYLNERQLRALIAAAAGADTADAIDDIFCSSTYGMPKALGLFEPVLAALGVAPDAMLHVGDNLQADQVAPAALGIATAHLRQFDDAAARRLRLEAAAATLLDPAVRVSRAPHQPHRPLVALRTETDTAFALGHDVLGPVLTGFADWVREEAEALAIASGRPVKPLFLLRDGHLPRRVAAAGGFEAPAVEISRFTARRAGFVREAAIRDYLARPATEQSVDQMARQLGLTREEAQKHGRAGREAFVAAMLDPRRIARTQERARAFADSLFAHLAAAGVARGDAVMLVDLGYAGTVQDQLAPVLAERFDLDVAGRYLLLREEALTGHDKKGYLDARHHDATALHALCGPIALVEQVCTIAQGSVTGYTPKGQPVRRGEGSKAAQNAVRDRIQAGAVAYAERAAGLRCSQTDDADTRRQAAAACLARLLFMPSAEETALFAAFDHDVNLGTDDYVRMLDTDAAAEGLRRRGLFYLSGVDRMYLPGELQPHGLPTSLAFFASARFGLDLRGADFQTNTLTLPVLIADDRTQTAIEVEAHNTHDGFYLATIPVGAGRYAAGVQFGALCDWVQVEEVAFFPVRAFHGKAGEKPVAPIPAAPLFEGMTEEGAGLYRCTPGALMLAPPPRLRSIEPHLLAITFRPIVARAAEPMRKAA